MTVCANRPAPAGVSVNPPAPACDRVPAAPHGAGAPPSEEIRRTRKLLLISYHFPPVGGAGVQRPAKFAKYLREFGWEPTVLAAANPSVPVLDASLLADLPPDLPMVRTRTLEPGYAAKQRLASSSAAPQGAGKRAFLAPWRSALRALARLCLQPDPQVLWLPTAYAAARRLVQSGEYDAILATAPSYSNLVLGAILKREFGIPFLADFRDEWEISAEYLENGARGRLARTAQQMLQQYVLKSADHVIATTRASASRLRQRTREAGGRAGASCIYNGFDEADFASVAGRPSAVDPPSPQRFRLVYAGTLWNLTSVEPLVRAVVDLQEAHPALASRLEIVLVGRKTPEQHALIEPLRHSRAALRELEYCPHAEATAWMASADALCLLLSDVPGVERVVSAKTFEYLALGSEILAIVPPGESAEIVWEFQPANVKEPRDVAGIRDWLAVRLQEFSGDRKRPRQRDPRAERYSRRAAAGELARLLDAVAGAR